MKYNVKNILLKAIFPCRISPLIAKRIVKAVLAAEIALIFNLIDGTFNAIGSASYLILIMAVTMHAGQRFGQVVEKCVLGISGMAVGLGFACLCMFIAGKILDYSGIRNSLAFLAVMEILMLFYHGYFLSVSERLFPFLFLTFMITHFSFCTSPIGNVALLAKEFSLPVLIGAGNTLLVNLLIFPEFGSGGLGVSIVEALNEAHTNMCYLVKIFIDAEIDESTIAELHKRKNAVTRKLNAAKTILNVTTYEVSYTVLPSSGLKPLLKCLTNAVKHYNALTGACESEYVLVGSLTETEIAEIASEGPSSPVSYRETLSPTSNVGPTSLSSNVSIPDLMKSLRPQSELQHGDRQLLLRYLVAVKEPVNNLMDTISNGNNLIKLAVARCYNVDAGHIKLAKLVEKEYTFSAADTNEVTEAEVNDGLEKLDTCIKSFDDMIPQLLEKIAANIRFNRSDAWLLPRDEYFLLSLFLLNFREYANQTIKGLEDAKKLLQQRLKREKKGIYSRRLWISSLSSRKDFFKYLSGGASNEPLKTTEKPLKSDKTELGEHGYVTSEKISLNSSQKSLFRRKILLPIADIRDEIVKRQNHCKFGFKVAVLLMLVSFPAYIPSTRQWYADIRGTWVGFTAILTLVPSLGGTIMMAFLRTIGLIVGSAWGLVSYEIGWRHNGGGRALIAVIMAFGYTYGYYYLIATPHGKAGIIGIVSCGVVVQSTVMPTVAGTIVENFGKRCVAMLVGATAATATQLSIFPLRARENLVQELVETLRICSQIEGILHNADMGHDIPGQSTAFKMCGIARKRLMRAESYRKLSSTEPRLKGAFASRSIVYGEIIFVLGQIVDRYDNVIFLRKQYGSAMLDELAPHAALHRGQVHGCLINTYRIVEQSLSAKMPLPQYMPSGRIAHLRLVNRVREMIAQDLQYNRLDEGEHHRMVKKKYMSWSACSVAKEQVVEYTEELVDLARLLVGTNQFHWGFLSRPLLDHADSPSTEGNEKEELHRRRTNDSQKLMKNVQAFDYSEAIPYGGETTDIPISLQRVATRRGTFA